jgi:hypothetical protein
MRRDRLKINRAEGLKQIKEDLRQTLKEHHKRCTEQLESAADYIYAQATYLVPVASGELQDSIQVDVSYSPRYPGIIATASAKNIYNDRFDYALLQEVREDYKHKVPTQAHFLEQPFREAVEKFYKEMGWQ